MNEKLLLNPQNLNRYAYSLNNPYRYIDPDGNTPLLLNARGFLEFRQQLFGWAPKWVQEMLMPLDASIGPMAMESGGAKAISTGIGQAYEIAKTGGKNAGLLKTYAEKSMPELEKAVQSLEGRVTEHLSKIANPGEFASDWAARSSQAREGLIKYWEKETVKYKEQAEVLRGIIKEKFGGQ